MNIETYLTKLSGRKYIGSILDIGANIGAFSTFCRGLWPVANIAMIEGNARCDPYLRKTGLLYYIILLGDAHKTVNFYIQRDNPVGTGASYYKEVTPFYDNPIVETRQIVPLDSFLDQHFDMIKIDTQGSELDIIKGGSKLIASAHYVILELPIKEYNKGAPVLGDIVTYMTELGFDTIQVIDLHRWQNYDGLYKYNQVFQVDAVFTKSGDSP